MDAATILEMLHKTDLALIPVKCDAINYLVLDKRSLELTLRDVDPTTMLNAELNTYGGTTYLIIDGSTIPN
jgi:hypothetical protein